MRVAVGFSDTIVLWDREGHNLGIILSDDCQTGAWPEMHVLHSSYTTSIISSACEPGTCGENSTRLPVTDIGF